MKRIQKILVGLVIIQAALVALVYWPRSSASADMKPLLGQEFDAAGVDVLAVEDLQGSKVEFTRLEDGWVLSSGGNYPANGEKIEEVLGYFENANTGRLVTRTRASHARLSVADDDYSRKVTMTMKDSKVLELLVGTPISSNASHVRLLGSEEVYQADDITSTGLGVQPSNWIDTMYLSLPEQNITKMILDNPQGRFTFEKNEQGTWESQDLPDGESLAVNNVVTLENSLKSLRMVKPLGQEEKSEYGLTNASAVVEYSFTDADGELQSAVLQIGNQLDSENGNYVVKSTTSPYYVTASPGVVGSFVNRTVEDFILPEPTATPASTPAP